MSMIFVMIWLVLGAALLIYGLKYPNTLYTYSALGLFAAAFAAYLGMSVVSQLFLGANFAFMLMLFEESGPNRTFFLDVALNIFLWVAVLYGRDILHSTYLAYKSLVGGP